MPPDHSSMGEGRTRRWDAPNAGRYLARIKDFITAALSLLNLSLSRGAIFAP